MSPSVTFSLAFFTMRHSQGILLLTLYLVPFGALRAELPVPELQALSQPVIQIGSQTQIVAHGARLDEIDRVVITDDGRMVDMLRTRIDRLPDFPGSSTLVSTGKLDFSIPDIVNPGLVDVQLLGRYGLSNPRRLLLTESPVEVARTDNVGAEFAQTIVPGRIYVSSFVARARRYFRVRLRAGERLRVVAYARQLDSRAMPSMQVLSSDGNELARGRCLGDWPAQCAVESDEDEDCVVVLHDFLFRGGDDYGIAIQASVIHAESEPIALELDRHLRPAIPLASKTNVPMQPSVDLALPVNLSGQFKGTPVEVDYHASKGQRLSIELISQHVGQLTDADLVLYEVTEKNDGEHLKQMVYQDDPPSMGNPAMRMLDRDPQLTWTTPKDGRYRIRLQDQQGGRRPTGSRGFQLRIADANPQVEVHAFVRYPNQNPAVSRHAGDTLRPGGTLPVGLLVKRKSGFDGPIEVSASGLPKGLDCPSVIVPAGVTESTIVVEADENAEAWTGVLDLNVGVTGQQDGGVAVSVHPRVVSLGAIPTWNMISHRPAEALCIAVTTQEPAPISVSVSRDKALELAAGQTTDVRIKLLRRAGAAENCILRAHDLPPGWACPDLTISGKETEAVAKLTVAKNALPGTYSFRLLGETKVKWKSNVDALQRLEKHIEELENQLKASAGDGRVALQSSIDILQSELANRKKTAAEQELTAWFSSPTIQVRVGAAK